MAKGNLFLGFGRGKIGDTVFYRQFGEQVSRARNRHPSNPQTPLQLLQRVCLKTSSLAFSMLQDITNHSFQGRAEGTPCQSRFTELNVALFRKLLAAEIASGDPAEILGSNTTNFSKKSSYRPEFMPYVLSEGTLPVMTVLFDNSAFVLQLPSTFTPDSTDSPTYEELVEALGLQIGDQLTFLWASVDDRSGADVDGGVFNRFDYARVILMPSDGDTASEITDANGVITHPNAKNEGSVKLIYDDTHKQIDFVSSILDASSGLENSVAAGAVIVSRLVNGTWQRSTQSFVLRPSKLSVTGHLNYDHDVDTLADAIASYLPSQQSSLYLNQAAV